MEAAETGDGGRRRRSDTAAGGACRTENELGRPALGDQQDLVEVDDTDGPMDKEATESLPAIQPEIPEIDGTVIDYVRYELGSFLDARRRQPSTESYGGISKHVGFLVQWRRRTNVNAMTALRTILSKLGSTGRNGHFQSL